jgi:hypothetical protein
MFCNSVYFLYLLFATAPDSRINTQIAFHHEVYAHAEGKIGLVFIIIICTYTPVNSHSLVHAEHSTVTYLNHWYVVGASAKSSVLVPCLQSTDPAGPFLKG